jgi:hypothetical protein
MRGIPHPSKARVSCVDGRSSASTSRPGASHRGGRRTQIPDMTDRYSFATVHPSARRRSRMNRSIRAEVNSQQPQCAEPKQDVARQRSRCGLHGPSHNLDGISSGAFAPAPRRRPLHRRGVRCVDDESPRRRPVERPYLGRHRRLRPRPARDHRSQLVPSRSARVASMAMAASGRSSNMACSSAPLRTSPRTPSGPAVTLAERGWPRSSESSPT